jgi:hypothetical protein
MTVLIDTMNNFKQFTLFETFAEHSILHKFKKGDNFNRRNTFSISSIEIIA